MEYKVKNYEASFALFQDVLLIQRVHIEEGQEDGVEIASTLNSIGIVAFAQREFFIARECFASSLEIRKKHLGIDHKDTATLWYNLATTYEEIGDEDVAEDMYRETLRIERLCSDGPSDDAIDTLQRLGRLYQSRGDLDEGLQHYKEALATLRAKSGTQLAFAVGKFLNLIGNIHLQRAEIAEMMECRGFIGKPMPCHLVRAKSLSLLATTPMGWPECTHRARLSHKIDGCFAGFVFSKNYFICSSSQNC
jgi:tetratricopeptide (TPR) repeat protein